MSAAVVGVYTRCPECKRKVLMSATGRYFFHKPDAKAPGRSEFSVRRHKYLPLWCAMSGTPIGDAKPDAAPAESHGG